MAEDFDLDLDSEINNDSKVEKRIRDLSEKVKNTAQERDEKAKAEAEANERASKAEKERDFYSSFADSAGTYPEATSYKDAIKEKVLAGYTVEDATVSVLAKEGKLTNYQPAPVRSESPAGGSATNQFQDSGNKSVGEMNRDERREALMKAEAEGSLANVLRRNM